MRNIQDIRKLARIAIIDEIRPANNADRLEVALIGGWNVVVGKGSFSVGEKVVYAEIDSLIPVSDERFELPDWAIKQAKEKDGELRFRVRSAKLRGNLSQGILFNVNNFPEIADFAVGDNVTEILNIVKQPDNPISMNSNVIGAFPAAFAQKSDSERIQNLSDIIPELSSRNWVITEKIDGTSTLIINDNGRIRVAGRNWELDASTHSIFTIFTEQELLDNIPSGFSVQGELFGPGIQKNPLNIENARFAIYNVFNHGERTENENWNEWMIENSVPIINNNFIPGEDFNVENLIEKFNGMKSTINPERLAEGVVFHQKDNNLIEGMNRLNFKVISNEYLLKH